MSNVNGVIVICLRSLLTVTLVSNEISLLTNEALSLNSGPIDSSNFTTNRAFCGTSMLPVDTVLDITTGANSSGEKAVSKYV